MEKSIRSSKERFHLRLTAKLSDWSASANNYLSILKTFANGKSPFNSPVNEKFVSKYLEKANSFNDFFG